VCVNIMLKRKDISNDLREANVVAHQFGMGYKDNVKQFGVDHDLLCVLKHSRLRPSV